MKLKNNYFAKHPLVAVFLFTFICLLNFDVYTKKLLIEKIIDSMKKTEPPKNTKRKRS